MTSEATGSKQVVISPRDFIHEPYISCFFCGKESFGVLMVRSDSYLRRCAECLRPNGYEEPAVYPLPPLDKKIIYIDQMGISNMMKALNPETRAGRSGQVSRFWLELFERLDVLAKLQLIVCPESSFHEWESLTAPFFRPLNRMYEHLSCEVSFDDPDTIARFQIYDQLQIWLGKKREPNLDVHRIANGNINAWRERYQIRVNRARSPELIQELRQNRDRVDQWMNDVFERWQQEKGRSFLDWYEEERMSYARVLVECHQKRMAKIVSMGFGLTEFNPTEFLPDMATLTIHSIREVLRETGIPPDEVDQVMVDFLRSDAYMEAPHIRIASMLAAAMAKQAASGRKRPPGRGFYTDVRIISTLLPYCDAMFIDNEFRAMLSEKPLRDELRYGTKVFSSATGQEFFEYLDDLKASASESQMRAVEEVYGPDWAKPYREIYEDEVANIIHS